MFFDFNNKNNKMFFPVTKHIAINFKGDALFKINNNLAVDKNGKPHFVMTWEDPEEKERQFQEYLNETKK